MQDLFIPVDANVICTDGKAGSVTTVVVDPVRQVLTHIVVKTGRDTDHLVPLEHVDRSDDDTVYLNCTVPELDAMQRFTELHFIKTEHHSYDTYQSGAYQSPYATGYVARVDEEYVPVDEEQVPPGELAVHRGAKVVAKDGGLGELEEFIIDANTGKVSHFVLRKGHLWGKRDISIPISSIEYFEGDTVHLKLDKQAVGELASVKVKHHYHD